MQKERAKNALNIRFVFEYPWIGIFWWFLSIRVKVVHNSPSENTFCIHTVERRNKVSANDLIWFSTSCYSVNNIHSFDKRISICKHLHHPHRRRRRRHIKHFTPFAISKASNARMNMMKTCSFKRICRKCHSLWCVFARQYEGAETFLALHCPLIHRDKRFKTIIIILCCSLSDCRWLNPTMSNVAIWQHII